MIINILHDEVQTIGNKNLHKMRKGLRLTGLFICGLLTAFQLSAADFTISGKVSLVTENVPLPFYEVSIADGEGKYIATVKTSFTGKYEHTFDIPEGEKVDFEVSVIDQCTGAALIEGFEKEGSKITVNFIVCDEVIDIDGDDDEESEEEEEEENEEGDDDKDEGFGLPDFLNCEAFGIDIPVCVKTDIGISVPFPNACVAFDNGFKIKDLTFCDDLLGTGIGGGLGDILGLGDNLNCDQLGLELPINVCVKDDTGTDLKLPICEALAEGYPLSQIEFCEGLGLEGLGDLGNLDSIDCEGLGLNFPVCLVDADGNEITYDNPCAAVAAGLSLEEINLCGNPLGNGLGDLDCESLNIELDIPICVTNELGETSELMLCEAITQGFDLGNIDLCDGALESLDCEGLGINLPVCAVDAEGNEVNYDNPCAALNAGLPLNAITFCGDDILDGVLDGLDCDNLGDVLPIPLCATDAFGNAVELNLCDALLQGLTPEEITICPDALDGISGDDCDKLGFDFPVCATNADGDKLEFPNPCDALAAGFSIEELDVCDNLLEDVMESAFGITDTEEEETVVERAELYPNPAYEQLILNLELSENSEYAVEILAINGNAIYRQKYYATNGVTVTELDVSSLSNGVYVVRILTKTGTKAMKFIKG